MNKRLYRVPYTLKGECYVWATSESDAASEVEYAHSSDIVESCSDNQHLDVEEYEIEEVNGPPNFARAI